jgi:PAS domain S-box-containing protein
MYLNYIWAATFLNFLIYFAAIKIFQSGENQFFNITITSFIGVYIIIFLIVRYGYFNIARHIFMFTVYAMICFGDHVFGQHAFNVLFYFAFLPTAFNLFSIKNEKGWVVFYLLLLFVLLLVSELYTYNLFLPGAWANAIEHEMHILNLVSAFALCAVYSGFIILNTFKKQSRIIMQSTALQTTLNNATGSIWSFDKNYNLTAANTMFESFIKQNCQIEKVPLGTNILSHFSMPGSPKIFLSLYTKVLAGQSIFEELVIDNQIFEIRAVPILNDENKVEGATFTSRSVTQAKKAERELIESQTVLKQITDTINDVFYLYDIINKKYLFISPNCKDIMGINDSYFYSGGTYTKEFVHKDDIEKVLAANKIVDSGKEYHIEYRIVIDGKTKWISEKSFPIKSQDGNTIKNSGILTDVTERKLAEEKLQESQNYVQQISNTINDAFFLYDVIEKKYLFVSPNCLKVLGVEDTFFYSGKDYTSQYAVEDDKQKMIDAYSMLEKNMEYDLDYRIILNGQLKWLNEKSFAIKDKEGKFVKMSGIVTDITARKLSTEKLIKIQQGLEEAQQLAQIGSWEIMLPKKDPTWSKEMFNIFEMDGVEKENINDIFKTKLYKDDISLFDDSISTVINSKKTQSVELRIVCNTDTIKYISAITSPILSAKNKKVIGIRGTVQNITRQKLAEIAKSNFLSTMSHEIRTPINGVIGVANLLTEEDLTPVQKEYINTLNFSAQHLMAVVTDILDFSKIESGNISFEKTSFNLEQICHDSFKLFENKAKEKNIEYKFSPCITGTYSFYGDATRLSQVITNLLSNAVKFTKDGGVYFSYHIVTENNNTVTTAFVIKDTGIGISPAQQERIFESFLQADDSVTREYGGTGLGLTICKKLIELQKGTITVDSETGKGATFTVTLNFDKHVYDKKAIANVNKNNTGSETLKGMKILVAEDNNINAMVLTRFLQKWHIECPVAVNGKLAVDMAENENFDLILMDLQMPEMDGRTATEIIRSSSNPALRNIPIVALTADALIESHKALLKNGFNDAVTKPFSPDALFKVLKKYHINKG